jgi:uncharacterized protein (UPF0261 family)
VDKSTVCVLATLDSKHDAIRYVCDALRAAGVLPWLVDLSLRPHPHTFADVSGAEVAKAAGTSWEALAKMSRADAAQTMIQGGIRIVQDRQRAGAIAAALGFGGANGSTMACAIMRSLPLAFPKAMVTPVAATAAVQWYVAESDIAMFPTIGDIWLNRVTRAAIDNAANAVAGMARAQQVKAEQGRPLIGVSSFGNLQPAVDRITEQLEARGYEVIHFHASGPGGRALEALAGRSELAGVIDLTTSELTDHLTGGVYSAGEARLTGAGRAGIPQVVVPGCLDFTNWWVGEVPERYRGREFFQYNVEIMLMRTDEAEFAALGKLMGERLAASRGPVTVLIPQKGWSALSSRNAHDLSGRVTGPWARPQSDRVFVDALRTHFAGAIVELELHINDATFADACVAELARIVARGS